MLVIDPNLHLLPWTTVSGPDINSVPATSYIARNVPLGYSGHALLVTNYSEQAGGADLVTCKRPIPQLAGYTLNYLRLRCRMFISSVDMLNLGRLETDTKTCLIVAPSGQEIQNVVDGSTQVNPPHWQIDGSPPSWQNTAFEPSIPTDVWFDYYHDVLINSVTKVFTVLGCGFGDQEYVTKTPDPQNVPWQTTNWAQLITAIQLQVMVTNPGTVNVLYDCMDLIWSDTQLKESFV